MKHAIMVDYLRLRKEDVVPFQTTGSNTASPNVISAFVRAGVIQPLLYVATKITDQLTFTNGGNRLDLSMFFMTYGIRLY